MELNERRQAGEELRVRARQQAVVAELGQRALAGIDLAALMDEAVELVAEILHVEYCKVLELLPDCAALLLRAGVGWQAGLVGQATVSAGLESQAGYTLVSHGPVIVEDLSTETRFSGPALLHDHGIVSGISVIIQGEGRPFGVMGAHTTRRQTFTRDDIHFLQAIANVLAEAIQRRRAEEVLRESEARFRVLTEHALAGVYLIQDDRFRYVNPALAAMFGHTPEELIGRLGPLDLTAPEDRDRVAENMRRRVEKEVDSVHHTFRGLRKDGTLFECESLGAVAEYDGRPAVLGMVLDITDRKLDEAKQAHFQSLLKAIGDVNQLIVRARDPQVMLHEACQILQRTRGYAGLWIGLLDETGQHLRQVASAGIARDVEPVDVSLDEPGPPLYCARTALIGCRPYLVMDVQESHPCATCTYRARAAHAGALAVTLLHREGCYGALVVYTEQPWAFHEDETELLSELANDLALGLYSLEAEEKLRESEEKYRLLVENANEAIVVAQEGILRFFNPKAMEITGYSQEELASKPFVELIHPDDQQMVVENHLRRLAGETLPQAYPFRIIDRRGNTKWVEINAVLIDWEGRPATLNLLTDITERKRAEEWINGLNRLKEDLLGPGNLDEKLKRVTEGVVEIFDADFARIWIRRPGDRCDSGCFHAAVTEGPHVCHNHDSCFHLVASSGRYTHIDGRLHGRVPSGSYKIGRVATGNYPKFITNDVTRDLQVHDREWARELGLVSFAGYRIASSTGEPIGVLALFSKHAISPDEDSLLETVANTVAQVIQTLRAEEALKEYAERLEEMVEERTRELREAHEQLIRREKLATLGQLAGGVAHELRNPLGAISNAAYFLNLVLEEPEPAVKETLEILRKEVRTSEKIISSLLDYARRRPPIRQTVNVNSLVQEALARADVPANIQVTTDLEETLPTIQSDPDQLAQVFDNLIRNAVQAMPAGGQLSVNSEQLSVNSEQSPVNSEQSSVISEQLSVNSDQSSVNSHQSSVNSHQSSVSNTQYPIPNAQSPISNLQSPISNTQSPISISFTDTGVGIPPENLDKLFEPLFTTKAKGIGLGLALCKMLVEGHGGTIEVASEVGKGSTFTVKLIRD